MALQVWLPLRGDLKNQGLNDQIPTSTAYSSNDNGKIGKCIKTATNSSIDLGYNGNRVNSGSISFGGWFKFNKTEIEAITSGQTYDSTYKTCTGNLIGNDGYGGVGLIWQTNDLYSGSFDSIKVFSCLRTTNLGAKSTSAFTISFDTWTHLFLTFDFSTRILSLWVNGQLKYTVTSIATFDDAVSRNLWISYPGVWGGNARAPRIPFYINDLRIYDHCLSPKEVKEISKGLVLHYKLDEGSYSNSLFPCGVELYDYIQNDGLAYIDTGIKNIINCEFKIIVQQLELYSGYPTILGANDSSSAFKVVFGYDGANTSNGFYSQPGNGSGYTRFYFEDLDVHTMTAKINSNNSEFIIDNNTFTGNYTNTSSSTYSLYLFARNNYGTIGSHTKQRVFSLCVKSNGNLIHNFLPCTYLGEPGMWDTVENKFYGNSGSGEFTLGNKIILKQHEYIQSSGTQWIDSGIKADQYPFKIEAKFNKTNNTGEQDICGNSNSEQGNRYCFVVGTISTNFYQWAGSSWRPGTVTTGVWYTVTYNYSDINTREFTVDGIKYATNLSNYNAILSNSSISLFRDGPHNTYYFKGLTQYIRIYVGNVLLRDFVPASYNGTPGMWDKVEWRFYENSGTGDFVLGDIVELPSVYDYSGYGNDGTIIGDMNINNTSPRYNRCINNSTLYPIKTNIYFPQSTGLTIACWMNLTQWGHQVSGLWSTSNNAADPVDYQATACNHRDSCFDITGINGTTYRLVCDNNYIPINTWKHVVFCHDGSNAYAYVNGELKKQLSVPTSLVSFNYVYLGYSKAGGAIRQCKGNWSDFRIYATALSEEDIKELYNTSAIVDNLGNTYGYQFEENNSNDVSKTGIVKFDFIEQKLNQAAIYKQINPNLLQGTTNGISKMTMTTATEFGVRFNPTEQLQLNTYYTASMMIRGTAPMSLYTINTGGNIWFPLATRQQLSSTEYTLQKCTFQVTGNRTINQIYICTKYGDTQTGEWFEVEPYSIKLEVGQGNTPWVPAITDNEIYRLFEETLSSNQLIEI